MNRFFFGIPFLEPRPCGFVRKDVVVLGDSMDYGNCGCYLVSISNSCNGLMYQHLPLGASIFFGFFKISKNHPKGERLSGRGRPQ